LSPSGLSGTRYSGLLVLCSWLIENPCPAITDFGGAFGEFSDDVFRLLPGARYTVAENAALVALASSTAFDSRIAFNAEIPAACDIFFCSSALHYVGNPHRVPPLGIVEALNVIEHIGLGLIPRPVRLARCSFVFSKEKKLSIAALSQTLPDRLMEQVMP